MAHIRHVRYGTIGVVLMLCALSGAAAAPSLPSIALDKVEDDFGDVHAGVQVEKRYVVSNKGNAPLVIEYIRTSCGCTTAIAQSEKIAPGEKTDILVSYDTTGLSAGKKTQSVLINCNDPKQPVARIRIFANVVHDVSLDPENLITQLGTFQNQVSFSLVARNSSDRPVVLEVSKTRGAISKALLTPEHVRIEPKSETNCTLQVTLADQEKRNVYPGGVLIATDHPAEHEIVLRCLIKVRSAH
jgi:hypothetical protein